MGATEVKKFMKYFLFMFVFIISFFLIGTKKIEIFGLSLFLVVNMLFCTLLGKELSDGSISYNDLDRERNIHFFILLISVAFSLVSSIMMAMTIYTLQGKFVEMNSEIQWSPTDRSNLDTMEILFITVTTFIGVVTFYVYNGADNVYKFTNTIFDSILNNNAANWLRVLFPIAAIGVGAALYGRLQMPSFEVNKSPKQVICDPANNSAIQTFKDSFIKTYWFIVAYLILFISRPFIEANFDILGISPSMVAGFTPKDRSLIFGQNPAISLLSLFTFGLSNLMGINEFLKVSDITSTSSYLKYITLAVIGLLIWFGIFLGVGKTLNVDNILLYGSIFIVSILLIGYFVVFGLIQKTSVSKLLLTPLIRWDILYLLMKYGFGLGGLVFAIFTAINYENIPADNECLFQNAYIRQLYIAFMFFLGTFYAFNIFSASTLTILVTTIMRYLVPPSLLGMTSYLVYLTNYFVHLAPKLIVE